MRKTRILCIAGKNSIAINTINILINDLKIEKNSIKVIPNSTDDGVDDWQPSLLKYCNTNSLSLSQIVDLYDEPNLIFFSLEYNKLINPQKFKTKKLYNLHFSALPKYKGMYTSIHPILNGEKESGVTIHCIDSGIDTGDIIYQEVFPIDINDTSRDLYFKYLDYGTSLVKKNINQIIKNNFSSTSQKHLQSSYYSRKSIDFNNISIDFNKTSFEIHNQLRAYIFPEYQLPKIKNKFIYKSVITDVVIGPKVLCEDGEKIILSGIDGFKIEAYIK